MKGAAYGVKGGVYRVLPGQVWKCGLHLVACGDLEKGDGEKLLAFGSENASLYGALSPVLFYVDPPWSPAYITRFRRGAEATEDPAFTVESLCKRIFRLASAPLLMEMGTTYEPAQVIDWAWQVAAGLTACSFIRHGVYVEPITYAGGKPARLFAFGLTEEQGVDFTCLRNTDDERTPFMAMNLFTDPGDVVVDLCLGLGVTARAAQMTGRRCWGLELHPRRCSAALADLRKLCGEEPSLIGEL